MKKWRIETNYYENNKDEILAKVNIWSQNNPEKRRKIARDWVAREYKKNPKKFIQAHQNQLDNNINFKIAHHLRARVRSALKGVDKSQSMVTLLGCSIEKFKNHLESLFTDGMTWENYGMEGWHVDHIKPCCSFDLKDPEQQKICFHYTNLQPLWAFDNFSKGGKY